MGQDGTLLAIPVAEHGVPTLVAIDYTRTHLIPGVQEMLEACATEHQIWCYCRRQQAPMKNDVMPKKVHGEKSLDPAFQRSNKHALSVSM